MRNLHNLDAKKSIQFRKLIFDESNSAASDPLFTYIMFSGFVLISLCIILDIVASNEVSFSLIFPFLIMIFGLRGLYCQFTEMNLREIRTDILPEEIKKKLTDYSKRKKYILYQATDYLFFLNEPTHEGFSGYEQTAFIFIIEGKILYTLLKETTRFNTPVLFAQYFKARFEKNIKISIELKKRTLESFNQNIHYYMENIINLLKSGGTILYPTDTIWGIGCDATNIEAVNKIFDIKKREKNKSMIILVETEKRLQDLVDVPEMAWEIIDLSEKPVTIVYENPRGLPKELLAEDGSIGIRLVKNDFCKKLITKLNKPLVSTSANFSGSKSPLKFSDISPEIIGLVDYAVEEDREKVSEYSGSSVIKIWSDNRIKVLRE